jgi:glycosyltransferase involved in cell wall biosynthesis
MNDITLIHTYYNEPDHLRRNLETWYTFDFPIKIMIVDDGSMIHPAYDVLKDVSLPENVTLSLYRVKDDIGFNSHGARNLAAKVADSEWLLFLDIDHNIHNWNLKTLVEEAELKSHVLYKFGGVEFVAIKHIDSRVTVNQFLISKEKFAETGGYDESYTSVHWGDRPFIEEVVESSSRMVVFKTIILPVYRGGRKIIIDNSFERPVYDEKRMTIHMPDPYKITNLTTKRINFEWERIL